MSFLFCLKGWVIKTNAKFQGSRLEDQRTEMPRPKAEQSAKTVPDDDFFALLMRAQAGRMEDQRATVSYFFDISSFFDIRTPVSLLCTLLFFYLIFCPLSYLNLFLC